MLSRERRQKILQRLKTADSAVSGRELAQMCNVSRQIIVSDIAMLRAEGAKILATAQGYLFEWDQDDEGREFPLLAADIDALRQELELIVDNGGTIRGVSVIYGSYGRLACPMHLCSRRDIRKWGEKLEAVHLKPLALIAGGLHTLTVKAENKETEDEICRVLDEEGFLQKGL